MRDEDAAVTPAPRKELRLRAATREDAELLWTWANDPTVRAMAFSPEPIPWETHVRWLESRLDDPSCRMLIAEDLQGVPVGQIRFDTVAGGEVEIGVSIDGRNRSRGLGTLLIERATREIFATATVSAVHAWVLIGNHASASAFRRSGFREIETAVRKGREAMHFVRSREEADER